MALVVCRILEIQVSPDGLDVQLGVQSFDGTGTVTGQTIIVSIGITDAITNATIKAVIKTALGLLPADKVLLLGGFV